MFGLLQAGNRRAETIVEMVDETSNTVNEASIIAAIRALGEGRFDEAMIEGGAIGEALRETAQRLQDEARQALSRTVDFSMQSSEAMAAVSHLTGDIREVSANTEVIAAAIEEMAASTNQVAQSSSDAAGEAGAAEEAVQQGQAEVAQAVEAMQRISEVMGAMSNRLAVLEQAAGHISGMTQSIEDISNQTRLLALNATIEAARAGEAGKGFAVVAAEVKSLSEQTSKATEQISERITTLNTEMHEMAEAMTESQTVVTEGEGVVNSVGEHIASISAQISTVSVRMNDIASVLEQQRLATDEIAEKVSQISGSAAQARDRSDEVIRASSSSEELIQRQFASLEHITIPDSILMQAKSDHMLWKKNLAEMLVGLNSLKPEELSDHSSCRLGKWYESVMDETLRASEDFRTLLDPHARVHDHGRAAAAKFAAGDREGAIAEYECMEQASRDVVGLLDRLIARG